LGCSAASVPDAAGLDDGINSVRDPRHEKSKWSVRWIWQSIRQVGSDQRHTDGIRLKQYKRNLARQGQGEISAEELARQTKNFECLVLQNAGLDKGYIAAVAELATQSPRQGDRVEERNISFRNGVGLGIVARSAFLRIWNTLRSLMVHKEQNA
jgi:hypothetical protein